MMSTINATEEIKPLLATTNNKEEVNKKSTTRTTWIIILSILVTASIIIYFTFGNNKVNNGNNKKYEVEEQNINTYVLPTTSLTVEEITSSKSSGKFIAEDETKYSWEVLTTDTSGTILFSNNDATVGFKLESEHEKDGFKTGSMKLSLYPSTSIVVVRDILTEDSDQALVREWISTSVASKHFIQLSMKLGASGYLGNENAIIGIIHNFAKWIHHIMSQDLQTNMDQFSQDRAKVNELVTSYGKLGHWPTTIDELKSTLSSSLSADLAVIGGNCDMWDECDNPCLGMCGDDCNCWSWVCGTCDCWLGCQEHDYDCSCVGWWYYCCWDPVWVRCDGSLSC